MLTHVPLVTLGDYCEFQTAYACALRAQVTTPKVQGGEGKRQPCGLFAEGESDPKPSTEASGATDREHRDD